MSATANGSNIGSTTFTSGNITYQLFNFGGGDGTSVGNLIVTVGGTVEYLMVGAGGCGGTFNYATGGGGAGQVITGFINLSPGVYPITAPASTGYNLGNGTGNIGGNATAFGFTALGGGGGATGASAGLPGASGGGGASTIGGNTAGGSASNSSVTASTRAISRCVASGRIACVKPPLTMIGVQPALRISWSAESAVGSIWAM
jgi:hypothetical protein